MLWRRRTSRRRLLMPAALVVGGLTARGLGVFGGAFASVSARARRGAAPETAPVNAGPRPAKSHVAGLARDSFPHDLGFNVFDPGSGLGLRVVTREEWGADESIRFREDGTEAWRETFVLPRLIVVHHTATPNSYETLEEAMAEVRSIYAFHTLGRDWGDIGYHAVIDRFGNIFEGRHGRGGDPGDGPRDREILSHAVVGGHTTEYEYGTVGVALLGDATSADWEMTEPSGPMWEALVRYCTFEAARSGIPPLAVGPGGLEPATTNFLRSDEAWHEDVALVCGHRDVQETYCPGDAVQDLLPALRGAIHGGLMGLRYPGLTLSSTLDERVLAPGTLIECRPGSGPLPGTALLGLQYCLEAWFKPVDSEDITYFSGYTNEAQPRIAWLAVRDGEPIRLPADRPGHYGIHVRALLGRGRDAVRSADRVSVAYLVPDPAAAGSASVSQEVGH